MPASGKRRRKRRGSYTAPPTRSQARQARAPARDAPAPARSRRGVERPPAPWGGFPLVEIVILVALVLLIVGFFMASVRGTIMIAAGITLASLAALELTLREHFSGYRSHSTVLAGFVAVVVLGLGFIFNWPQAVKLAGGVAAFALGFYLFREAFKRRSGGFGFR